jgi:hypothetical protein
MGITALWYVGIFTAVIIALHIVFKAANIHADMTFSVISDISMRFYMFVAGIVCPLVYFSHYLAVGVTRKQFAVGIFAAGAVLSLCFAILRIPLLIVNDVFSPLAVLVPAFYGALAFLVGWTAAIGFHVMRGLPIIIGIACSAVMFHGLVALEQSQLPLLACLWISVAAILVVGVGLLLAIWRIPVKC